MLQTVPQLGMSHPRLLGSFKCLTPITIQVIGPATLYLAETDNAIMGASDNNVINALQINQATGVFILWWKGDLWAAGSTAFAAVIGIPGVNTGSGLGGSDADPTNVLPNYVGGTL
jgi:hypothetical protein